MNKNMFGKKHTHKQKCRLPKQRRSEKENDDRIRPMSGHEQYEGNQYKERIKYKENLSIEYFCIASIAGNALNHDVQYTVSANIYLGFPSPVWYFNGPMVAQHGIGLLYLLLAMTVVSVAAYFTVAFCRKRYDYL
jgi:hypothetical protein